MDKKIYADNLISLLMMNEWLVPQSTSNIEQENESEIQENYNDE